MDESLNLPNIDQSADRYYDKYRENMDLLESSILGRSRPIEKYDHYALGKQLESYEMCEEMMRESGSIASLGPIPNYAFDVITTSYATSPIAAIASVQPIEEQSGTIYYRSVRADTTRGNMTRGDIISSAPTGINKTPQGFAADEVTETAVTTADTITSYNAVLAAAPIRPGTIKIQVTGSGDILTLDDGKGNILGRGLEGSINYTTGAVALNFAANPGAGNDVLVTYATDFESSDDVPRISSGFGTRPINAQVFVLADSMGLVQTYTLRKRFGLVAEDAVAEDLVSTINAEIMGQLILKLQAKAQGVTIFNKRSPDGISYNDHKQKLKDVLADEVETVLIGNAAQGNVNVIVAGLAAAGLLSTLPGFTSLTDGNASGPHIYGRLDGKLIVRVPGGILNTNRMLCMFKGNNPFVSAAVYAPYMPLVTTAVLPGNQNPLQSQMAACVMAGVDCLTPEFVTILDIVDQDYT